MHRKRSGVVSCSCVVNRALRRLVRLTYSLKVLETSVADESPKYCDDNAWDTDDERYESNDVTR